MSFGLLRLQFQLLWFNVIFQISRWWVYFYFYGCIYLSFYLNFFLNGVWIDVMKWSEISAWDASLLCDFLYLMLGSVQFQVFIYAYNIT